MTKRVLASEETRKNVSDGVIDGYIKTLKRMVDCKTVFEEDMSNKDAFDLFYRVLEEEFPLLHKRAQRMTFGSGCFVYKIEGKNAVRNIMVMSHHDVVDGDDKWETDPFCAIERDGALWGRGTIDTKTPLFAELRACEELLEEGYSFDGMNLFIGSSNNEEVGGDGMVLAAEYFRKEGIRFDVILDEGGAITQGLIPGVSGKSAMVAVHEKSRHMFKVTTKLESKGHGGLNSATDNALVRMSGFIQEVTNKKIYKGRFYPEVKATFTQHAPYMSFPMNVLFGNLGIFGPVIKKIMLGIPQTRGMLATEIVFTTMFAGEKCEPQIRAKEVEATMMLRCIREEDMKNGLAVIRKIGEKYGVEITQVLRDYCEPTDYTARPYRVLQEVLHENFPDVMVAPFLLTAGTDARRFSGLADSILRFAPIDLDKVQYVSIHGANEHIKIKNVGECVCFYKDFVKRYNLEAERDE